MIPELVLILPKVLIIIGSLRFHSKVDIRVAFNKSENFLEFRLFGYFFGLLVELYYFPLVNCMYDLMYKVSFATNLHITWILGHFKNVL